MNRTLLRDIAMKLLSASTILPATAIAIGTTVVMGDASFAATDYYVYPTNLYPMNEPGAYSDIGTNDQDFANGNWSTQQAYPGYHYAYYNIARPEYIL